MSKRRFEFVKGGSSKFWEVDVRGKQLSVCFGRIGTAGTTKDKSFGSPADAKREAAKLVGEKTKKGYVEK
jgi:DNA ligase-1